MEQPVGVTAGEALEAISALPLEQMEEASGELHRRVAVALRQIGERLADDDGAMGVPPRRRVAELTALVELAGVTLASAAAGGDAPGRRIDRHPSSAAAVMYAAPTIDGLLQRLDQDRRLVTSLARHLESRLEREHRTPWGDVPLRSVLMEAAIIEPARCAQELERRVVEIEEAEIRRLTEAHADTDPPGSREEF